MTKTFIVLAFLCLAPRVGAEVTRVDVASRADVGASGYEKIVGTIHFAVNPIDPRNAVIADLDKARADAGGRVAFSADLFILRPKDQARSNGVALIEVSNRGNKGMLSLFSRATSGGRNPSTEADLGDGFLTRQGYTLVWVGWQFDAERAGGGMKLDPPVATGLRGIVRSQFIVDRRSNETTLEDLEGYTLDASVSEATLTVRDALFGTGQPLPRNAWSVNGYTLTLSSGLEPGRWYELAVGATDLPIAGAGLAAFRDTAAWLKHQPDALAPVTSAYAYGSSQSGRFLRTFMYYGFNSDEKGRQVFDGVLAHIAGGARLSINERGARPNASKAPSPAFPFANAAMRDPVSGRVDGLLDNPRARANQPKVFYTNTDVEYWGADRSAALVHTSPDGKSDLTLPENVRFYFLAGTQHAPTRFPPRMSTGQQLDNPLEYAWTMRALLTAMDRWVRQGTMPPASQHPKLSDGTLVKASEIAFPAIPGVQSPKTLPGGMDGGAPVPFLVPAVDADGNDRSGIRTAEQAVPVATFTGWNFRSPSVGGPHLLGRLIGSEVFFAATDLDRKPGDPRRSVDARYGSRERYMEQANAHSATLVKGGYLLADDVPQVMKRVGAQWELEHQQVSAASR